MPRVKVTASWLKTGFILEDSDKKKSWETLFSEQNLFRYLASYVFNGVSNTPKMKETRKVIRRLISIDDDEIDEGTEKDYDDFLETFFSKLERASLSDLIEELEILGYVTDSGKNRAFSKNMRTAMKENNTKLIDLSNDLKVSQLLGHRYSKGLDDTERKTKPAQEKAASKYESRSSRLLGAFDRSEPVLYPSTLSKHMTVSENEITIDTEKYFTELFKVEGYGKIGTDSFQFNWGGSSSSQQDKDDELEEAKDWAKKTKPDGWKEWEDTEKLSEYREWKRVQEEEDEDVLEDYFKDEEDDAEGITQEKKMLTKAEGGSTALASLQIEKERFVLTVFGDKQYFDDENHGDRVEDLWNAIEEITMPTKKEIMGMVKSQRKSNLKEIILAALTPQENKIQIGKTIINISRKEWEDDITFHEWIRVGGGRSEDRTTQKKSKEMAKRVTKLKTLFDQLERNWGKYVYDAKEAPFDKFIITLSTKSRKELIDFFSQLIVSVKQDKYNLDNPKQTESGWAELHNTMDDQLYEFFTGSKPERITPKMTPVEGKKKPIGIEETGNRKQVTEIKEYFPAFGSHDTLVAVFENILKNIKSSDYLESVPIIPLLELADNKNMLEENVLEQLVGSKDWKIADKTDKDGKVIDSVEWRSVDTSGHKIMTASSNNIKKILVDTKVGGYQAHEFKTGRFSETRVRPSKEQAKHRKESATDNEDAEELTLVYHEYIGLKQLIG